GAMHELYRMTPLHGERCRTTYMRHAAPRFSRLRGRLSGVSVDRSPNGQAVELGDLRWDPGAHLFALLLAVCVELGTRWIGLLFMRQHPDMRGVYQSFFRGFRLDESLAERCSAPVASVTS